jgi:DEAD/DEAH box helicase domain-containing protein
MQAHPARFLEGPVSRAEAGPIAWLETLSSLVPERALSASPETALRSPGAPHPLAHARTLPARPARHGDLALPLQEPIPEALAHLGIERLYTHQVQAIEALRGGLDTVIVTGTASGKSLCYHLPVIEALLRDPDATALYLFPTKALAQDQLKSLTRLMAGHPDLMKAIRPGVYDGDTQATTRRRIRDSANLVLSNPDMLHQGILPGHPRWGRFLRNLRYVVVDEIHAYRGIFGSHVANVFRRLERVARHVGGDFRYVLCSATIRNPRDLAESLTGRKVQVVDDDGAPRGERHFAFWNPPFLDSSRVERRSSNVEGSAIFAELIARGAQALVFTKSRVAAELVYRYARERLEPRLPDLASRLKPYRGTICPRSGAPSSRRCSRASCAAW